MLRGSRVSEGPEVVQMDTLESDSMVQQEQSQASHSPALDNIAVSPMESQSEERITPQQLTEEITLVKNTDTVLPGKRCKFSDSRSKSVYANLGQPVRKGQSNPRAGMLTHPGSRKNSEGQLAGLTEIFVPGIQERRVTWSQSRQTASNTPHTLLLSGYAEEAIIPSESAPSTFSVITEYVSVEPDLSQSDNLWVKSTQRSVRSDQSDQSEEKQSRRDSWYSQSGEDESLIELRRFSRKLKSPRLPRRRPISIEPNVPHQTSRRASEDSGRAPRHKNTNSSSNSDSDSSNRRPGKPSHRVLKLSSLNKNRGVFWNVEEQPRLSPELHTFSDPELPKRVPNQKPHKPPMKTQRSLSTPDMMYQGPPHQYPPQKHPRPPPVPSPPPRDFQLKDSPLQSLLERAKERGKEREGVKKGDRRKEKPTATSTPSPLPSDWDRETEGEEVDFTRLQVTRLSHGWREGNVDGSDDERKSR